jgi:hypothetical protein
MRLEVEGRNTTALVLGKYEDLTPVDHAECDWRALDPAYRFASER